MAKKNLGDDFSFKGLDDFKWKNPKPKSKVIKLKPLPAPLPPLPPLTE